MKLYAAYLIARSLILFANIWYAQHKIVKAIDENRHDDAASYINLVDINKLEKYKGQHLRNACRKGNIQLIKLLLKKGAHIDLDGIIWDIYEDGFVGPDGIQHDICQNVTISDDHVKMVELLLESKPSIVNQNERGRALHYACASGSLAMVKLLIEKKAKVNGFNYERYTPLYYACKGQHLPVIEFLLKNGADANLAENCNDRTIPLEVVIRSSIGYPDYYSNKNVELDHMLKIIELLVNLTRPKGRGFGFELSY